MLEGWGVLGPNRPGFDPGDIAGFLADVIVDPLNLVPVGALTGALGLGKAARTAAKALPLSRELLPGAVHATPEATRAAVAGVRSAAHLLPEGTIPGALDVLSQSSRDMLGLADDAALESDDFLANLFRNRIRENEFESGLRDVAGEYTAKLHDPTTGIQGNVINPESGMRLWDDAQYGRLNLQELLSGETPLRVGIHPDAPTASAYFSPNTMIRMTRDAAGESVPELDKLGRLMMQRRADGRVARAGEEWFGMAPWTDKHRYLDTRHHGQHESLHKLINSNNLSPELWKYLESLRDIIRSATADNPSLVRFGSGRAPADYLDPEELFTHLVSLRTSLRKAGQDTVLPKAFGPGRALQGIGPEANNTAKLLTRLLGRDKVNEAMRILPMAAAVAATPVAASIYGNQGA
jgi:hypothetical protein